MELSRSTQTQSVWYQSEEKAKIVRIQKSAKVRKIEYIHSAPPKIGGRPGINVSGQF